MNEQEEEQQEEEKRDIPEDKPSTSLDRYEGYEELLTVDDDVDVDDVCPPKGKKINKVSSHNDIIYPFLVF